MNLNLGTKKDACNSFCRPDAGGGLYMQTGLGSPLGPPPMLFSFKESKVSDRGLLAQTLIIHRMRPARLLLILGL